MCENGWAIEEGHLVCVEPWKPDAAFAWQEKSAQRMEL
jgi:hypothetical protein